MTILLLLLSNVWFLVLQLGFAVSASISEYSIKQSDIFGEFSLIRHAYNSLLLTCPFLFFFLLIFFFRIRVCIFFCFVLLEELCCFIIIHCGLVVGVGWLTQGVYVNGQAFNLLLFTGLGYEGSQCGIDTVVLQFL